MQHCFDVLLYVLKCEYCTPEFYFDVHYGCECTVLVDVWMAVLLICVQQSLLAVLLQNIHVLNTWKGVQKPGFLVKTLY